MRERILAKIASTAISRPYLVLGLATLGALAGGVLLPTLSFSSSRFELIGTDDHDELEAFLAEYGSPNDLVAAVTADDPASGRAAVDALTEQLADPQAMPEAERVLSRVDLSELEGRALLLMPTAELESLVHFVSTEDPATPLNLASIVEDARTRLASDDEAESLEDLEGEGGDETPSDPAAGLTFLSRLLWELTDWLTDPTRQTLSLQREPSELPLDEAHYLVSRDGRTRYLFVSLRRSSDRYEYVAPIMEAARAAGRAVMEQHPEVEVAWTGYPAIAVDEVDAIRNGSMVTGVLAALLVMALFAFGFRSLGAFVTAGLPLVIGVSWAFGMIALTVGELNLLTQVAAPVFFGLGIDFAVHLVAAYDVARSQGAPHREAIERAVRGPGKGILTGGATTAGAFLAMTVADYGPFRELGWVAGAGLLLTMASVLLVTPALLTIGDRRSIPWLLIGRREPGPARALRLLRSLLERPLVTAIVGFAIVAALASGLARLRFDAHVEALLPEDAESVVAARQMTEGSAFDNEYVAAEVEDLDSLRRITRELAALPSVGRVESAAPFLPDDAAARLALLRSAPDDPPGRGRPDAPSSLGALRAALDGLAEEARGAAGETERLGAGAVASQLTALASEAERARRALPDGDDARLAAFDRALAAQISDARERVASADDRPIELQDLPAPLRARWVGPSGRYAVYAYPAHDLFAPGELDTFVEETSGVTATMVGYPVELRAFLRSLEDGSLRAVLLALLVVLAILVADFRDLRDVFLALVPVVLGVLATFGLLGWLGVQLNVASVAALPLLLGIGVDDGVHLIHRRRAEGTADAALFSVLPALILTTATTVAGFGTLGFATHRGMQSFSFVMVIGALSCLLATVLVLPSLIRLLHREGGDGRDRGA